MGGKSDACWHLSMCLKHSACQQNLTLGIPGDVQKVSGINQRQFRDFSGNFRDTSGKCLALVLAVAAAATVTLLRDMPCSQLVSGFHIVAKNKSSNKTTRFGRAFYGPGWGFRVKFGFPLDEMFCEF